MKFPTEMILKLKGNKELTINLIDTKYNSELKCIEAKIRISPELVKNSDDELIDFKFEEDKNENT